MMKRNNKQMNIAASLFAGVVTSALLWSGTASAGEAPGLSILEKTERDARDIAQMEGLEEDNALFEEAELGPDADAPREQNCADGKDDDGDSLVDCGDYDCHDDPACQPDGDPESTEARCSDWVDNNKDGATDCDDYECQNKTVCKGSWDLANEGSGAVVGTTADGGATPAGSADVNVDDDADPADLIGSGKDEGGETNNFTCSDGIDNDNDGFTDCEDVGCRLDTQVTVCQPAGNFRFSVVARVKALGFDTATTDSEDMELGEKFSTEFDALQMRVLGQIPFVQNSFFLISMRAEKTPRVTFAMFQVPIKNGHFVNVNSGGGGLSTGVIRSISKNLMLDPPFYLTNAFEQGNGASIEFGGPVTSNGKLLYRTFAAGGSGRYAGNIGGTFFPDGDQNYAWSAGAQLQYNAIGFYGRLDSALLYVPVPTTLAFSLGAKYDQRPQERYPALNVQGVFRWKRLSLAAEAYGKRELAFKNWQLAYNVQLGVLAVKKRLLFGADFGQYIATNFEAPPASLSYDLRRQLQESAARATA
ncbi:MAG: hypothetical protein ACPHRO_01925, partial [Nannocystaceae bacterium]